MLQTEIDRLRRQIAEKEAAVKAAQAQLPSVTKVNLSQAVNVLVMPQNSPISYRWSRFP